MMHDVWRLRFQERTVSTTFQDAGFVAVTSLSRAKDFFNLNLNFLLQHWDF